LTLDLSRPGVYTLPQWRGAFEVMRTTETGVPASRLKACRVAARNGGEQWQHRPRSVPRSLKKQYQAAGVAVWQREGPLLYAGEQLVFVPGLGLDARVCAQAPHGRRAVLALQWRPDGADARRRATTPQRLKSPPP
jgi:tRNA(Ile)-lysidine synthase